MIGTYSAPLYSAAALAVSVRLWGPCRGPLALVLALLLLVIAGGPFVLDPDSAPRDFSLAEYHWNHSSAIASVAEIRGDWTLATDRFGVLALELPVGGLFMNALYVNGWICKRVQGDTHYPHLLSAYFGLPVYRPYALPFAPRPAEVSAEGTLRAEFPWLSLSEDARWHRYPSDLLVRLRFRGSAMAYFRMTLAEAPNKAHNAIN